MNIFIKLLIGCVIGLFVGALMLCFEALTFLLPVIITLMLLSGIGIIVFGMLWMHSVGILQE